MSDNKPSKTESKKTTKKRKLTSISILEDGKTEGIFLHATRMGLKPSAASGYAGISDRTYRSWLKKGTESEQGVYYEFVQKLIKAKSDHQMDMINIIKAAAESGDWKAASWTLERAHTEDWGRVDKHKVELSKVDVKDPGEMTEEELLSEIGVLSKKIPQ